MSECVQTHYWNNPSWISLREQILSEIQVEGFDPRPFTILEPFVTVTNIYSRPKRFMSKVRFRMWLDDPANTKQYTIYLLCRADDLPEAKRLANILCVKFGVSTFVDNSGAWL